MKDVSITSLLSNRMLFIGLGKKKEKNVEIEIKSYEVLGGFGGKWSVCNCILMRMK